MQTPETSQAQEYPKILILALGRINERDTSNNGLFLRNLFGKEWPRERLAQIYSSGDVGDTGFFGHYYRLGPKDRILGSLFYRLKANSDYSEKGQLILIKKKRNFIQEIKQSLKEKTLKLFVDTGLYELIFRPKISNELLTWVNNFKPDVIFAQGYNLTFSWLPVMLKERTGVRLCVLTTDDWPKYLYAGMYGESTLLKWLVRPHVDKAAMELFSRADFPFAFGFPMGAEYQKRYGKTFTVLNHSDSEERFKEIEPLRLHAADIKTIIAIGTFNEFRLPLLLDIDEACKLLSQRKINARLAVLSSAIEPNGKHVLDQCQYIDVLPDPGNDLLPAYLKGADILLLAEGFNDKFVSAIELSISTKAHLFMFSGRPIIVYAAEKTGVAKYAADFGWAEVVSSRKVEVLADTLSTMITAEDGNAALINIANQVVQSFHSHSSNRAIFIFKLLGIPQ